jgi:membrane associated rhomboid family serine protease
MTLARDRRSLWIFLIVGALVGLCVGILVSVATEVHFAPEIGTVLGLAAGWGVHRLRT